MVDSIQSDKFSNPTKSDTEPAKFERETYQIHTALTKA